VPMQPSDFGEVFRRTHEILQESEERFRLLVEGVKDYAIFMLDTEGYITTWNLGAQRIKGYEAEEIIGEHFSIFYTDEDVEREHPEEELRIAAADGSYEEEGLRVRKDGSLFWASVLITALRDEEGELRGFAKVTRDITAHKGAEERERLLLREQAAREWATHTLESISDAFYSVDRDWRFTYVNNKAEELWGRSREELLGKNMWEEFPQAVGFESYRQIKRAMEENVTTEFETISPVLDAWIAGRAYPSAEGLSVYFQDVTQRKKTEEEILRSEEAQRFLAEASNVLSSSLDYRETLSSVARLAVPTLADWCAVDILEVAGSLERLAVEHPDPEKVQLAYELERRYPPDPDAPGGLHHVLRTGEPEMMAEIPEEFVEQAARDEEHRELLRKLGLRSYMIVPLVARGRTLGAISFVSAESGRRYGEAELQLAEELARRAALAVDNARLYEEAQKEIAERRRAQEELRGSRDQLEAILRGAADGITAQDSSGRIIYANETAARLVGFSSARDLEESPLDELMARFELLDEEGRSFPAEKLPGRRALAGEEGPEEVLCFRILATDEERWAIVKAMPIFGEQGTVQMAVNIFRDITESKRAEEALRHVRDAERKRIARDLHDSVLQDLSYTTAAMGMIMLQAEDTKLKEQLQAAVAAVRRGAQGLREVVNDLRIEDEEGRPFTELVESVVRRNRMMARNVEISLEVGERVPSSPLGETGTQVSRIIQEALTNTRRHSSAKSISVGLRMDGDDLLAEVSDDGIGFGPESLPGVGLRSMRERVAILGGELEIESEKERGTSVRLRVPLPQGILE
jgi:PAS domain S-box-containing protein